MIAIIGGPSFVAHVDHRQEFYEAMVVLPPLANVQAVTTAALLVREAAEAHAKGSWSDRPTDLDVIVRATPTEDENYVIGARVEVVARWYERRSL